MQAFVCESKSTSTENVGFEKGFEERDLPQSLKTPSSVQQRVF